MKFRLWRTNQSTTLLCKSCENVSEWFCITSFERKHTGGKVVNVVLTEIGVAYVHLRGGDHGRLQTVQFRWIEYEYVEREKGIPSRRCLCWRHIGWHCDLWPDSDCVSRFNKRLEQRSAFCQWHMGCGPRLIVTWCKKVNARTLKTRIRWKIKITIAISGWRHTARSIPKDSSLHHDYDRVFINVLRNIRQRKENTGVVYLERQAHPHPSSSHPHRRRFSKSLA